MMEISNESAYNALDTIFHKYKGGCYEEGF